MPRSRKDPPFFGGPATAKRFWGSKAQPALPLLSRADVETEALRPAMDRLSVGTQRACEGQLKWWRLFCKDNHADEDLLMDFLLHTAVNGGKAPGGRQPP